MDEQEFLHEYWMAVDDIDRALNTLDAIIDRLGDVEENDREWDY